jgi:hypothetical protein
MAIAILMPDGETGTVVSEIPLHLARYRHVTPRI